MRTSSVPATLFLLAAACQRPEAPPATAAPEGEVWLTAAQVKASKLELGAAEESLVPETVRLAGRITFDDLRVTHVFSPVTGRVTRVLATPGQQVAQGAPLAEIESPDVGTAMSELLKAQADAEAARRELDRQRELFQAQAGPQREMEQAKDNAARAQAELERTRQKLRLLRLSNAGAVTQTYTLRAPIGGEVVSRAVSLGMEVQGQYGGGTPLELFTIGDLDQVWMEAEVHELDVGRVRVGQPVEATSVAYPGQRFLGTVQWMSEVLDPQTHTARVRASLPNPDRELRPELYVQVQVTVSSRPLLAVPRTAVLRLGDVCVLYVARGPAQDGRQRFERRRVTLPSEVPAVGMVPVLSGLDAGEVVVREGAILLSES